MLTLGLNTAGPACEVSLCRGSQPLAEAHEAMVRGQDARLALIVRDVCGDAGLALAELDRIAVIAGPGSFTGVRVGVAFARGLALALSVPCLGLTSLEAALPEGQQGSAIVLLPAKRRPPDITYWAQRFRSGAPVTAPEEIGLAQLAEDLRAHPHFVYGDGLDALGEAMPDLELREANPSARLTALKASVLDPDSRPPSPVYVRTPDAALPKRARP